MTATIRVYSDFVCPWCYLGLARLKALRAEYDFAIDYRPFQLRADTPAAGVPTEAVVPAEVLRAGGERLRALAAEEGVPFVQPAVMWNTREAHEAMAWAAALGRADAFHEAVMAASFVAGRPLVRETYLAIARELGLDEADLEAALEAGRFREETAAALAEGPALGVTGVPCFVFENNQGIAGAHPREVFVRAFADLGVPARKG